MFSTYMLRLGILFAFVLAVVFYDLIRKKDTTRLKEYSTIVIAALFTGVFGIIVDSVTSRISPEYFLHGKGLGNDPLEISALGGLAGVAAGFLLSAVLVYVNRKNENKFLVLKYLPICFAISAVTGAILGLARYYWFSFEFEDLDLLMNAGEITRFMTVWFIHVGIYAGGVAGVVAAGIRIKKQTP